MFSYLSVCLVNDQVNKSKAVSEELVWCFVFFAKQPSQMYHCGNSAIFGCIWAATAMNCNKVCTEIVSDRVTFGRLA